MATCLAIYSYAQQAVAFGQRAAHGVYACLVVCGVGFRLLNGAALNVFYGSDDLHRMIGCRSVHFPPRARLPIPLGSVWQD